MCNINNLQPVPFELKGAKLRHILTSQSLEKNTQRIKVIFFLLEFETLSALKTVHVEEG